MGGEQITERRGGERNLYFPLWHVRGEGKRRGKKKPLFYSFSEGGGGKGACGGSADRKGK